MTDCKNLDLARQWAEWMRDNPEVYGGTSDRARAAADLISSLPDEWVGAERLREVVADHHIDMSEELMEALGALLPAPPAPRTMAEIEWDDAEHHLAEASVAEYNLDGNISDTVVMLKINEFGNVWALDTSTWGTWALSKDILTPTGRKYRLEPEDDTPTSPIEDKPTPEQQALARDIFGSSPPEERHVHWAKPATEAATPRPEDVPVGDPWQVEVDGKTAIGYRNDPDTRLCWAVVYRDEAGHNWMYDSDVTLIARLVPETTEQDTEQVLDPAYTYRDEDGSTWTYYAANNMWICRDSRGWHVRADSVPPTRFGPYTRIEKDKADDE